MSNIEKNKEVILDKVIELITKYKHEIPYQVLDVVLTDKILNNRNKYSYWTYDDICAIIIYGMHICHLIPLPKAFNLDGTGILREADRCLSGLMLFYHTHLDELAVINYSNKNDSKIPKLKFADNSHELFHWGAGSKQADFCEINNINHKIEAKFNYAAKGSVSSTHGADDIIDCLPGGGLDWYHYCSGQLMGKIDKWCVAKEELPLLDRNSNKYPPVLTDSDLMYLKSGEILLDLDKILNISFIPKRV